jgi:predicted enzyme related to lactoylglutathione lyase
MRSRAIKSAFGRQTAVVWLGTYRVVVGSPLHLIEFPADDPPRARRFWTGVLGVELVDRSRDEGEGWQTGSGAPLLGVHERGRGPGDTNSLPYFEVDDIEASLRRVRELGGEVIHPGARWAVCRDSEGSPFGLAARKT